MTDEQNKEMEEAYKCITMIAERETDLIMPSDTPKPVKAMGVQMFAAGYTLGYTKGIDTGLDTAANEVAKKVKEFINKMEECK